ncbi:MAG TPA: tetratricopeptide repeat protein [Bryobacteraceae bacterium]|nr:tetratricopeptide repeat protein [Bryobacteraceae bacterium]HPT25333.1 tetratricopeptide repeat protein [Bryobacteraceae bacterium]
MDKERRALAVEIFHKAYGLQKQGELELAAALYLRSIEIHPTAEAYTNLGWVYSLQNRWEDAIAQCRAAIGIDPGYGNPYNDIGAYLIELGKPADAIEWLEKAAASRRYRTYHFPWYNLGRAYAAIELYSRAVECFQHALDIEPSYLPAEDALEKVKRIIQ